MSKVENLVRLNDGHVMPMIGFGTCQMPKPITEQEEVSSDGGNSRKKFFDKRSGKAERYLCSRKKE